MSLLDFLGNSLGALRGSEEIDFLATGFRLRTSDAGINASMSQWGIDAAKAATYVAAAPAATMDNIAYEKWVALYLQGYEAWAEWRRLDAPALTPAKDILNGTAIPVRHGYGARTASANKANHDAAVAAMGKSPGDFLQDVRVWWDTK